MVSKQRQLKRIHSLANGYLKGISNPNKPLPHQVAFLKRLEESIKEIEKSNINSFSNNTLDYIHN